MKFRNATLTIRALLTIFWVLVFCLTHAYHYCFQLYSSYPVLQQARQLGAWELLKRLLHP